MLVHCDREWNIQGLCKSVNMGKSQFFTYYKMFFNTTPKADIILARISKARRLLSYETHQVQEVAELCGFHDVSHFSRYFKKHCGCAPKVFMQNMQEKNQ